MAARLLWCAVAVAIVGANSLRGPAGRAAALLLLDLSHQGDGLERADWRPTRRWRLDKPPVGCVLQRQRQAGRPEGQQVCETSWLAGWPAG